MTSSLEVLFLQDIPQRACCKGEYALVIAIIDGEIDNRQLKYPDRVERIEHYEKDIVCERDYTHATMIASILEQMSSAYNLINLVVMYAQDMTNMNSLYKALQRCMELSIDFILLSMGSIFPSDSLMLKPLVQQLSAKGVVIIAAQSNCGKLTFPASFPEVLSVQRDYNHQLLDNQYLIQYENLLGVDVTMNFDILLQSLGVPKRNSFIVPIMASLVLPIMQNKKMNKCDLLSFLSTNTVASQILPPTYMRKVSSDRYSRICCCCEDVTQYQYVNNLLITLNLTYNVQTLCVCFDADLSQAGWIKLQDQDSVLDQIELLEISSTVELLIICCTEVQFESSTHNVDMDMLLKINYNNDVQIYKDGIPIFNANIEYNDTAQLIVDYLS